MNTKAGGLKVAATIRRKYGEDYFAKIGRKGGQISRGGGFASALLGSDNMTGPERASVVGRIGGRISKRTKKAD
jgi:general stress protein YciG